MYGCSHSLRVGYVSLQTEIELALALLARGTVNSVLISGVIFEILRSNYKNSRLRDGSTCSEPEIPRLLF